MPIRNVHVGDALVWLEDIARHPEDAALVAVLPDAAEIDLELQEWAVWFTAGIYACCAAVTGPVVFVQTDRLANGVWIDKSLLVASAVHEANQNRTITTRTLTFHKIVTRRSVGSIDLHRPTYSHIVAYGGRPGTRTPDVIDAGERFWRNGMDLETGRLIIYWLAGQRYTTVFNPFCGEGTVLALANDHNMDAHGCEIDPDRAARAMNRTIQGTLDLSE